MVDEAPKVGTNETLKDYIPRCMADSQMMETYGDTKERYSHCLNAYNEQKPHAVIDPEGIANTP